MAHRATPITYKASSVKADADLIAGAAAIGASKKFKDHSEGMAEKFEGKQGGSAGNTVEVDTSEDEDPAPTKLDPMTMMKIASMAGGGKKKEGGGKTTVIVKNNTAPSKAPSTPPPSQADNAVDPV